MRANPTIVRTDEWEQLKPRFHRFVLQAQDKYAAAQAIGLHWTHVYRLLRGAQVPRGLTLRAIRLAVESAGL